MSAGRSKLWIGVAVVVVAAAALFYLNRPRPRVEEASPSQPALSQSQQPEEPPAEPPPSDVPTESSGPVLELGRASQPLGLQTRIPLEFTAEDAHPAGMIHAEVEVPPGPWKFLKVAPPPRPKWKLSAHAVRDKIELRITSDEPLVDGELGYLVFSLDKGADESIPARITKLEISPPESGGSGASRPEELEAQPDEAAPAPSCFFFTH